MTPNQLLAAEVLAEPNRDQRLEVHMLAAIARVETAIVAYNDSRNEWDLIDGLLDVRNRLTKGLELNLEDRP